MSKINTVFQIIKRNPFDLWKTLFTKASKRGWLNFLSDKTFLRIQYKAKFGRKLNLEYPQTYNEKLQWLKLYDRNPEYHQMVDKYEAKKFVANRIGEQYIIPTLGVWDYVEDIDMQSLPHQFVLKTTMGGVI